jgi:hypothetical protein
MVSVFAVAPRNLQQPQQRQRLQQTIVDHERTLSRRKKLPAGKSELARALVGSSSAQSYSSFPLHRGSIANAKAIPRSEEFFQKAPLQGYF